MSRRRFLTGAGAIVALVASTLIVTASPAAAAPPVEETGFGSNPGQLQMFRYTPAGLPANAPLVVAMHGCAQTAGGFGEESGWRQLADRWGFALLLPQQPNRLGNLGCFAWFDGTQIARGGGEALSVRQMVDRMLAEFHGNPSRVYVTGMSAGGAMAAVMLAAYPEVFAGGGIVAGLPYKCATSQFQAFTCLNPGVDKTPEAWGDLVRGAAPYTGPRAPVSLWQGTADTTVVPANLTELVDQWTDVLGVDRTPDVSDQVAGQSHQVFADTAGRAAVETYRIAGMRHGEPVGPNAPADRRCGQAGAFSIDVGICAAYHIGVFWHLNA
jgi:poly(hydroxyalkanoate) depolymerase family esterase